MKLANAVIGANFGDEGKGLLTDYLASQGAELVVRFNGGAQAGHTVVTPENVRHVFNSFGSGTLAGVPTFLSKFFIVNPLVFQKERKKLEELGVKIPQVYVDARCFVSTPWDMLINQYIESRRGDKRHGSCGLGIGETIERSINKDHQLRIIDLCYVRDVCRIQAKWLRDHAAVARLQALNITLTEEEKDIFFSETLLDAFVDASQQVVKENAEVIDNKSFIGNFNKPVFEGAQGLLLDQNHPFFPHVTRSRTGIANVLELCEEAGIEEVNANYITRCYVTRHGAGPLPFELLNERPFKDIVDETNIPNKWQGSLRFAHLNPWYLYDTINFDLTMLQHHPKIKVNPKLAVTCVDQMESLSHWFRLTEELRSARQYNKQNGRADIPLAYISRGPTREDVYKLLEVD